MLALLLLALASYWPAMDECKGSRGWAFDDNGNRYAVCADGNAGALPDQLFRDGYE